MVPGGGRGGVYTKMMVLLLMILNKQYIEYQLRYHLWLRIVRTRCCDIFDYNYKIPNSWYCFLHICSWGICYFYIDKLQPTSLVYQSSQLFFIWILNSPRESSIPMIPSVEELPATMYSPIPVPIDKMPAADVGIGHLWMVVMFWNHLSSNSQILDIEIHLSQWNQIFLHKHRQQIVVSKDGNHQRCLSLSILIKWETFHSTLPSLGNLTIFPTNPFLIAWKMSK